MKYKKEEELVGMIARLKDTELESFSNKDQLLILANLVLMISEEYFPDNLKDDLNRIITDGRSVAYERVNHPDNTGINLASCAHHLISLAGECHDSVTSN